MEKYKYVMVVNKGQNDQEFINNVNNAIHKRAVNELGEDYEKSYKIMFDTIDRSLTEEITVYLELYTLDEFDDMLELNQRLQIGL